MNHLSLMGRATLLLLGAAIFDASAQAPYSTVHYSRGQDVSPTYEGWEGNPDGTYTLYFGYFNRNTEEEPDVPLGPSNHFDPGTGDQGQPTHFYTGRRWFVFKVNVPKTWTVQDRLVWTLTSNGRTSVAKGWLQPEWEVDKAIIAKNGVKDPFLGIRGVSASPGNMAPTLATDAPLSITLPAKARVVATASDDGNPAPGPSTGGRPQGVQIRWITLRGPAKAEVDPDVSPAVYGRALTFETTATFPVPGNYRLRAIASDGALFSTHDIDIQVHPAH